MEESTLSVVGCVKNFSDRSQTSLKVGALIFYPLHVTLLNCTNPMRRRQIHSCSTVVTDLPVSFQRNSEQKMEPKPVSRRIQRTTFLYSLHKCTETSLALLLECTKNSIHCHTKHYTDILHYFLLGTYVADIPGTENFAWK